MIIAFAGQKEIADKYIENALAQELGKDDLTEKYNMDRVTRDHLSDLGMEDTRSEFDRRCDQREREQFDEELEKLITAVGTKPIG